MIEWWLSSFFKDGINNKQKLKEDLEVFIGGYIEITYRDVGVSINAWDVIRDINIPEITDLRMGGALYFKFKGVDCSVVPDGRLFVY